VGESWPCLMSESESQSSSPTTRDPTPVASRSAACLASPSLSRVDLSIEESSVQTPYWCFAMGAEEGAGFRKESVKSPSSWSTRFDHPEFYGGAVDDVSARHQLQCKASRHSQRDVVHAHDFVCAFISLDADYHLRNVAQNPLPFWLGDTKRFCIEGEAIG